MISAIAEKVNSRHDKNDLLIVALWFPFHESRIGWTVENLVMCNFAVTLVKTQESSLILLYVQSVRKPHWLISKYPKCNAFYTFETTCLSNDRNPAFSCRLATSLRVLLQPQWPLKNRTLHRALRWLPIRLCLKHSLCPVTPFPSQPVAGYSSSSLFLLATLPSCCFWADVPNSSSFRELIIFDHL